jgi:hypothetical protein
MGKKQIAAATALWYKLWSWPQDCLTDEYKKAHENTAPYQDDDLPELVFPKQEKSTADDVMWILATDSQKALLKMYSKEEDRWFDLWLNSPAGPVEEYCKRHQLKFRQLYKNLKKQILAV